MYHNRASALFMLATLIAVSACSNAPDMVEKPQQDARSASFTAEDKRIARKLSIGTASLAEASVGGRAVLCGLGLEAIDSRLRSSGALSAQQGQAFDRAREIYRRRAVAGYPSAADVAEARRRAELDYPTAADRARLAIACLRELA